jgi:hypothetical protein
VDFEWGQRATRENTADQFQIEDRRLIALKALVLLTFRHVGVDARVGRRSAEERLKQGTSRDTGMIHGTLQRQGFRGRSV